MRIGRTLPPAAAPIDPGDLLGGFRGLWRGAGAVAALEQELRSHFQVRHCSLVSSGKAAMTLILLALKERFPGREEVLIPAFTCYSVPSAIVRAGLKVTLCDIDADTLDFDYEALSARLKNPRLLCIFPTHLFGLPADIDRVRHLIGNSAVPVVEDAAQAMGGEWKGRKLGTLGDVGFFSLGRGKALSTVEGGVILTDSDEIAGCLTKRIEHLNGYSTRETAGLMLNALALMIFLRPSLFWLPKSLPFLKLGETIFDPGFRMRKMSGFQAGLARGWQKRLERFQAGRRAAAREWLSSVPPAFRPPGAIENGCRPLLRFPVRTGTAEQAMRLLHEGRRLGISSTYPDAINGVAALAKHFSGENFPAARAAARQTVTLPVHRYVTPGDRGRILELLAGIGGLKQ